MPRALSWFGAPLLLGLFALGATWFAGQGSRAREPRARAASAAGAGLVPWAAEPARLGRRELVPPSPAPAAFVEGEEVSPARRDGAVRPLGARTERELLAQFLRLGREHPEELRARVGDVLDGSGPTAEKVALLRALQACAPEAYREALEHALRELAPLSENGALSVPEYALEALARLAPEEPAARRVLWRVAFETPGRAPALRRAAASAFARNCGEAELEALRGALLLERDELLVAGALAELDGRAGARAASVVAYLRPAGGPTAEPGE